MTMKCDANFKNQIVSLCLESLEHAGFRRYRKDSVDWPISKDFNVWAGLNTGLYEDRLEISPFVGVHAATLENIWLSLSGKKYPGAYGRTATYAMHMGEIDGLKGESAFAFTPLQSPEFIQSETNRLSNLYITAGLSYAKSIASYESLLPLMQSRAPMLGGYPQRVVVCLYLLGRKGEARHFAENFLANNRDTFERFATPFLAKLATEGL